MSRTLDLHLPLEGHGLDAVLDDLDTFIANSVRTNRPEFMNPLWGDSRFLPLPVKWLLPSPTIRCTRTNFRPSQR